MVAEVQNTKGLALPVMNNMYLEILCFDKKKSRSKVKVIQKCEKLSSREGFQAFGGVVTPKEGS